MPSILVHHRNRSEAGVLSGPVLIGRVRACGVVIDSNQVSRVHAWIGRDATGNYFVNDTFSREGTRVNGTVIGARHKLVDGDEIQVGDTRIVYKAAENATSAHPPLDLNAKVWTGDAPDVPVHFVCECGKTISVSTFFAGRTASCAYCDRRLHIPRSSGQIATNTTDQHAERSDCSICQCAIGAGDAQTTCPGCGITVHTDCWVENKGCSVYGCAQVNILDAQLAETQAESASEESETATETTSPDGPAPAVPWRYIALGAVTLGLVGAGTVGYLLFLR